MSICTVCNKDKIPDLSWTIICNDCMNKIGYSGWKECGKEDNKK